MKGATTREMTDNDKLLTLLSSSSSLECLHSPWKTNGLRFVKLDGNVFNVLVVFPSSLLVYSCAVLMLFLKGGSVVYFIRWHVINSLWTYKFIYISGMSSLWPNSYTRQLIKTTNLNAIFLTNFIFTDTKRRLSLINKDKLRHPNHKPYHRAFSKGFRNRYIWLYLKRAGVYQKGCLSMTIKVGCFNSNIDISPYYQLCLCRSLIAP